MDPNSILDRMDEVLEEERDAIRRLDGARVEAAALEKTALVQSLTTLDAATRTKLAPRFRAMIGGLRRNGVLLVHARGVLVDVLRARGAELTIPTQAARGPVLRTGHRVSIRG